MSVKLRPYRNGGFEVDISIRLATGERIRERRTQKTSRSVAQRWGEERERHLLLNGQSKPKANVPTLKEFVPRYLSDYARANRQKPSSVAAKETILRTHLVPMFGRLPLSAITDAEVQRLKLHLRSKAPKTVNNILTVLSSALKNALAWGLITSLPCTIRLVPVPKPATYCHDFAEFEQLVKSAKAIDSSTGLLVLLGGEAGLRSGEMIALQWQDVDLDKRCLSIHRSSWNGCVTSPKNGRPRTVPMTDRLTKALQQHRHSLGPNVLCQQDGTPLTRQQVQYRVKRAARLAGVSWGVHLLRHTFCSHLAMRGAPVGSIQALAGHQHLSVTERYMHHTPAVLESAIAMLEQTRRGIDEGETAETGGSAPQKFF